MPADTGRGQNYRRRRRVAKKEYRKKTGSFTLTVRVTRPEPAP
jgi:hypothetical protein